MNEVNATGKIRQQNPDEIITANVRIADRLIAARKNKTSLQIHYKDKSYSGIFSKINSDNIVLLTEKVMPFDFTDTDVLVEFDLEDCHYSLETTIIISSSREVLLTPPVKMLVFTTRTRERIDVRNKIFIKFSVIAQPESLAAIDAAASKPSAILRAIYAEIAKNEIDLPTVFRLVQKELAKFSHSAAIKLKRKNENYDLAANLVLQYKKPLYIIKASDMASWLRPLTDNGFISFLPFYQRVKEIGWTPEQIKDHLHILVETYAKKNIGSLLIMPILLFGNVAGWIRLLHRSPLAYNIEKISQIEE
ncbi:MAG: hypothetical protein A2096_02370 [Spirochaetes bacterium GWF1_41_5]|nr:MAG: hypothetical protein A2096_02370 [Spirochaetes bacterium GWF1_41_5]